MLTVLSSADRLMGQASRVAVLMLLAAGAIAGALSGGGLLWLHWVCKPLATLWLLLWVGQMPLSAAPARCYRRWIFCGLCLSLLGDILLMLPQGLFVPGLLAFLLAHVCYIIAFAPGAAGWRLLPLALLIAVIAGANLAGLWPHLPDALRLPVSAYVQVIALMAVLALARACGPGQPRAARLAAAGALLFLLSDSWLAWDRFAGPLPAAIAGVLASYWAAQYLIAASCVDAGVSAPGRQ